MKALILLTTMTIAVSLGLTTVTLASTSGGDTYISKISNRLKVGDYKGRNPKGQFCSVKVKLESSGKGRRYSVEVSPTTSSYATDSGPTEISFSSSDARVLMDDAAERGVSNSGDDYLVLGVEKKGAETYVRAWVKRGKTLKVGECTF
ncbi:hypothetical protein BH10BDE1_BH10BDE1_04330 [soil metagenome]